MACVLLQVQLLRYILVSFMCSAQLVSWAAKVGVGQNDVNQGKLKATRRMAPATRQALEYEWTAEAVLFVLEHKMHNKSGLIVPEGISAGKGKRSEGRQSISYLSCVCALTLQQQASSRMIGCQLDSPLAATGCQL
jgi:hypothetical protein